MRELVRDRDRLVHIVESIDNILNCSNVKTKEELVSDKLRYYGIVKNIEIIGEAAYKLTRAFCRMHPDTPWDFIAKMRHVLVHDYYQIKPVEVWKVIQEDLAPLREQVSCYLDVPTGRHGRRMRLSLLSQRQTKTSNRPPAA